MKTTLTTLGGLALTLLFLSGCSSAPEPAPAVPPPPSSPRDVPDLGRPRPKLLPDEALAGAGSRKE